MTKAFGMGTDFSTSLACIAILFSGDVGSLTWSIGKFYFKKIQCLRKGREFLYGGQVKLACKELTYSFVGGPYIGSLISALGGEPEGISYSHNKYESDASATRVSLFQVSSLFNDFKTMV